MHQASQRIACVLLFCALCAPGSVHARERIDQVVVVRAKQRLSPKLIYFPGDLAALLVVKNAPKNVFDRLKVQRGRLMPKVERLSFENGIMKIRLFLSSPRVVPQLDVLSRSRMFTVSFIERKIPALPNPAQLIGHVPGLYDTAPLVGTSPPIPKTHPCRADRAAKQILRSVSAKPPGKKRMKTLLKKAAKLRDRGCRAFAAATVSKAILRHSPHLQIPSRWAFLHADAPPWEQHRRAYSFTSLIAAQVLIRDEMFIEAEMLLTLDKLAERRGFGPHVALTLSHLYYGRGDNEKSKLLHDRLISEKHPQEILHAAWLLKILNSVAEGAPQLALQHVWGAHKTLTKRRNIPSGLWMIGADIAVAQDELDLALKLLPHVLRFGSHEEKQFAKIRLGDIEVRLGRHKRALKKYNLVKVPNQCIHHLLRHRRMLLRSAQETDDQILHGLDLSLKTPSCRFETIEAAFTLAQIKLARGDDNAAIAVADRHSELARSLESQRLQDVLVSVAPAVVSKHWRSAQWHALASIYEARLRKYKDDLPPQIIEHVAEAYHQLGLYQQSTKLMLTLLREHPEREGNERLVALLARGYLELDDAYRADLTLRFFEKRYRKSNRFWAIQQMLVEKELATNNPKEALRRLKEIKRRTPSHDPAAHSLLLKAHALALMGQSSKAAELLLRALRSGLPLALHRRGATTKIVSACARDCNKTTLTRLLTALPESSRKEVLSDRLKYMLERRAIKLPNIKTSSSAGSGRSSIWQRLMQLSSAEKNTGSK